MSWFAVDATPSIRRKVKTMTGAGAPTTETAA